MTPPRPSPVDYRERDLAVQKLTRRCVISTGASIGAAFMGGKPGDHVLRRLADAGQLKLHRRAIESRFSYATERDRTLGPTPLDTAIGVMWHCTLDGTRRYPLLHSEVEEQFGSAVPGNVPYVLTEEFGDPVVMRVHHSTGKVSTTKKHVEDFFLKGRKTPGIAAPLAAHDFGLVCLCPTEQKFRDVEAALDKAGLFSRGRLLVALGPVAKTYGSCLKKRGA